MEYIYAAILIHKLGGSINENTVTEVIEAAGGKPDHGKAKALVAALTDIDIDKAIKEAAIPVAAPSSGQSAVHEKKEEVKEVKEDPEKAAAGLGALFG